MKGDPWEDLLIAKLQRLFVKLTLNEFDGDI